MSETLRPDICVVGGGSAGLSVAAGAAQMGASVVLVERDRMGGDCLNVGCVPSKALIAAAGAAAAARSGALGAPRAEEQADFAAVMGHVRRTIEAIAPHDSVERFTSLGVTVLQEEARFLDPRTIQAGGRRIAARRFVIATGSRPRIPDLPGLREVPFLTNETVFSLGALPRRLLVIGGGPVGCELGQAFARLGTAVVVVQQASILPKDDPELVEGVRAALARDGVTLFEDAKVTGVSAAADGLAATVEGRDGGLREIEASHLLVAAGRAPTVGSLDLEAAGVDFGAGGITVDASLRTSNRRIYAIGDCVGDLPFTHVAGYHASLVVRQILFRLPAKVRRAAIPWCTYTDPELAQVGLTEAAAEAAGERPEVVRLPFVANDRARAEGRPEGLVKAVVGRGGRVLGAGIVGLGAGELILPWVLAIDRGLKIGAMATVVAPYPTRSEASKGAAGTYYARRLFTPRVRRLVKLLARLG